ncbi:MAG: alpha/beta fold hydrolase [Vicinamibacterales bacterium]
MHSRKPALVLVPGMMCDDRLWRRQVSALRASCDTILVAELRGATTIAALADRILAVAPPRFAVAGLSMGGIVVFEMWRRAADRITHVALLDTNPSAETSERQAQRGPEIQAALTGHLREMMVASMKPLYLARAHRSNPALLDSILAMALDLGPQVFRDQSLALRDRPDSRTTLPTIDCPTLVLCGREDTLCPIEYHMRMAETIPHADLVVLADCGHLSPLEQSEAVNDELARLLARSAHGGLS